MNSVAVESTCNPMELKDLRVGDFVFVSRKPSDIFNYDFQGTVKEVNNAYAVVEDQEGDCWSVDASQIELETEA